MNTLHNIAVAAAFLFFFFSSTVSSEDSKSVPRVETTSRIPSDAVVIFDGEKTNLLVGPNGEPCPWPIEDGVLVCDPSMQPRQQGLWTKLHFRDAQIHVEFMIPESQKDKPGNSGLYLHGLFEHQIYNSVDRPGNPEGMIGSIYGVSPPLVQAGRAPGRWQTYDVIFIAPRRNEKGEPVKPGSITSLLNGVLVQHGTEITERVSVYTPLYFRTTVYAEAILESLKRTECGPMQLQDHDSPTRFRNIWIRPLDDQAFLWEGLTEKSSPKRKNR
jgi:hypothetical protein